MYLSIRILAVGIKTQMLSTNRRDENVNADYQP